MNITMRQLQVLAAVAESGSVSEAARRVHLTQAGASMALRALEAQLGALFDRSGRRLYLNDRGRFVAERGRRVLREADALLEGLAERDGRVYGRLHVGGSTTIGIYLLPEIIGRFQRRFPDVECSLVVENTESLVRQLIDGQIDAALIEGPVSHPGVMSEFWRRDQLCVIVGPEHPWAKKGRATRRQLSAATWIMREKGSGTREVFEQAFRAQDLEPHCAFELGHTEAIKHAIEAGLGIACLSRMTVAGEIDSGRLVEVKIPFAIPRELRFIQLKDRHEGGPVKEFHRMLKERG
ncbi:LysR family transcriptional regulator [bacterium]|nr:LysR family transcriptional regulator [bacterium]